MRLLPLDMRNEADAAAVVLVGRIVEALGAGRIGRVKSRVHVQVFDLK
jgi:hypothetical protein